MESTDTHVELAETVRNLFRPEINPHVEEWESDRFFPAHSLFKKMGDADLLEVE